jgi:hypothetical protein
LAIEPTVTSCVERLKAMVASDLISALHSDAKRIAYGKGIDIDKEDGKL